MSSYNTPGVYVREISKLPASIAPVATAIPAFIGYTEKHQLRNGDSAAWIPVRIQSMLEYEEIFGGAFNEKFQIELTDHEDDNAPLPKITVSTAGDSVSDFILYYQLRLYFANGGGPCYVISTGNYDGASDIDKDALIDGLNTCEMEDEITLLVIPEAMGLNDAGRKEVYDAMLAQCTKLQDRFAILDVESNPSGTVFNDGKKFRGEHIGPDNLKYGAAYYPALQASSPFQYLDPEVDINSDSVSDPAIQDYHEKDLSVIGNGEGISTPSPGVAAVWEIGIINTDDLTGASFTVMGESLVAGTDFQIVDSDPDATAANLEDTLANNSTITDNFGVSVDTNPIILTANSVGVWANSTVQSDGNGDTTLALATSGVDSVAGTGVKPNKSLYNAIKKEIAKNKPTLYPCGAIAGLYARIDRDRGVWKAPANASLNGFLGPVVQVTHEEQGGLNVDAGSGKSINAIRHFNGKGLLVWGARTLAGQDNEWRYVPVRRLFIFVEESVRKATEFVVFEPNDAKTWSRTKAMISNFLTGLWREGALAGASADDAFYVKVGLGETMSTDDILNGIMNVEIGMAAVRPAEFIVLKFSHKLQES